jgi:ABC-type antimicrobial peptide transport system permease subunit
LALASTRRHEILVRAALGATRMQLIWETVVDSTLIAGVGGVLGFFLAVHSGPRRASPND